MRSERMASLANYILTDALNPAITASTQWFERTLDDSANRRISISEAFLAADSILELYFNVASDLVVYPRVIEAHLNAELPFMATENIMMKATSAGGDRQELHERIRQHSMEAARQIKEEGKPNDLLERIERDGAFGLTKTQLDALMDPKGFTGRASQQTEEFLEEQVAPLLMEYRKLLGMSDEIKV